MNITDVMVIDLFGSIKTINRLVGCIPFTERLLERLPGQQNFALICVS